MNRAADANPAVVKTPPTTIGQLFNDMDGPTSKVIEISGKLPSQQYCDEGTSINEAAILPIQQLRAIDKDISQNAGIRDSKNQLNP